LEGKVTGRQVVLMKMLTTAASHPRGQTTYN